MFNIKCFKSTFQSKSEDYHILDSDIVKKPDEEPWKLYAIFDGHHGNRCSEYVKENLWLTLHDFLPKIIPDWNDDLNVIEFKNKIRDAIAQAFNVIDMTWFRKRVISGTTVTLALIIGPLLTVANIGDSQAFLHNGNFFIEMTRNHRLEDSEIETNRLLKQNQFIAPLSEDFKGPAKDGKKGFGPKRIWPGGLSIARSIGDIDISPEVVSIPNIKQMMIKENGIRLIMASDGLWDILPISKIKRTMKRVSLKKCPSRLMNLISRVVQDGQPHDDITIIAIDIISQSLPDPNIDFKHIINGTPKFSLNCYRGTNSTEVERPLIDDVDMLYNVPENYKRQDIVNLDCNGVQRSPEDYTAHGSTLAYNMLKTLKNQ